MKPSDKKPVKHIMVKLDDLTYKKGRIMLAKRGTTWQEMLESYIKEQIT